MQNASNLLILHKTFHRTADSNVDKTLRSYVKPFKGEDMEELYHSTPKTEKEDDKPVTTKENNLKPNGIMQICFACRTSLNTIITF